jgi:hypothetical protein
MEKNGKSVCTECAGRLKGIPYPLRPPSPNPLYASDAELKRALRTDPPTPRTAPNSAERDARRVRRRRTAG